MDSLVKWGLILGGGYLILDWMGINPLASLGIGVAAPQPVTTTTPQANNPIAAVTNNTKQLVIAAAVAGNVDPNSYQSTDTWNYYYQKVRGIAGPSPESLFPNVDRNKQYSIDEWWSAMTGAGFSGMGNIAHFVNPYHNWQGTPFGSNLNPTGMEKYIVRTN